MRRLSLVLVCVLAVFFLPLTKASPDPVEPAGVELALVRDVTTVAFATDTTFFQGDTITFTNSVMYTGSDTNSAVQNLDGCVITVIMGGTVGSVSTSVTASGYAISTNNGTWGAELDVPAINPCNIQVTVSNNFSYTYQWQKINTKVKLD